MGKRNEKKRGKRFQILDDEIPYPNGWLFLNISATPEQCGKDYLRGSCSSFRRDTIVAY